MLDEKPEGRKQQPMRNKFIDPVSPLMPESIPVWSDALLSLSRVQEETPEGVNAGYPLPDPGLFLAPDSDATKAIYFSTWLKLRDIVTHRITAPQATLTPLSNKLWRSMLGMEKTAASSSSKEGLLRAQAITFLKDCLTRSNTSLDLNHLRSIPAVWRGQELKCNQLPPPSVAKEILWELYELNFRLEFLALDGHLSKSDKPATERQILIDGHCWPNNLVLPDIKLADKGVQARSPKERWNSLFGLHMVMSDWRGPRPPALRVSLPILDGSLGCEERLEQAEKSMAEFYTQSFLNVFGRAAIVPHRL